MKYTFLLFEHKANTPITRMGKLLSAPDSLNVKSTLLTIGSEYPLFFDAVKGFYARENVTVVVSGLWSCSRIKGHPALRVTKVHEITCAPVVSS